MHQQKKKKQKKKKKKKKKKNEKTKKKKKKKKKKTRRRRRRRRRRSWSRMVDSRKTRGVAERGRHKRRHRRGPRDERLEEAQKRPQTERWEEVVSDRGGGLRRAKCAIVRERNFENFGGFKKDFQSGKCAINNFWAKNLAGRLG